MLIAVQDREAQRDARLLPGGPPPRQELSRAHNVGSGRQRASQQHLARTDALRPEGFGRVAVTPRQMAEDRLAAARCTRTRRSRSTV